MPAFFDSNVLVYAVDRAEPAKREVARALFEEHFVERSLAPGSCGSATVPRPERSPLPLPEAAKLTVEDLEVYCTLQESGAMILAAVSRTRRFSISF